MFKKIIIAVIFLSIIMPCAVSGRAKRVKKGRFAGLQSELNAIADKNYGRLCIGKAGVGIAFVDLGSGYRVSVNGTRSFPAASIIKLPAMAYTFYLSDRHLLNLNEKIKFRDRDKLPGAGILQWLRPSSYSISSLCRMMISLSDNTATRLVMNRVGKKKINQYCRKIGLNNTFILDETALVEPPSPRVNLTTPNDVAKLLARIENGSGFSASARKEMLSFMLNQKYVFGIPRALPRNFRVANKTGNLEHILHDAAIVYSPRGKYVLCVFTKNFKNDKRANRLVIHKVSEIVASYYR
jgi:beta-lactamase class A